MDKVTGKEGKGVTGTGFDSAGVKSNNYSELPRSSNAAFGIEPNVVVGVSEAAGTPDSKGQNVGAGRRDTDGDTMGVQAKFAIDKDVTTGTVRGGLEGVTEKRTPGVFGVSAKSGGSAMTSPDSMYGSGARKGGTAAQFGEPGRGGSMGLAVKGLAGNTSGPDAEMQKGTDSAEAALKSKGLAHKGLKGSNATD